jgi:glutaredoxin
MCSDCQKLKVFLESRGIEFTYRDIRENPEFGEELAHATGKLGVPYLKVDGEWLRGYEPGKPFTDDFAEDLLGL